MLKITPLKLLFSQYRFFFIFLIKFLLFYVVSAFLYALYLNQFNVDLNEVDGFTKSVAKQVYALMHFFNFDCQIIEKQQEPFVRLIYNGKFVARVVEGCNAISVMILFVSFVFAFSTSFIRTITYIIIGLVLLHVLNIIRIAFLVYALYHYPEYKEFLHGTIFPLIIYGIMFLLWFFWVTKFSENGKRTV